MPLVGVRSLIDTGTPWSGGRVAPPAQGGGRLPRAPRRGLPGHRDVGVDAGVHRVDPGQHRLHHLEGRDLARAIQRVSVGRRHEAEIAIRHGQTLREPDDGPTRVPIVAGQRGEPLAPVGAPRQWPARAISRTVDQAPAERLKELDALRQQRLITEEEYETARKRILQGL